MRLRGFTRLERPPTDLTAFVDGDLGWWGMRRVRRHLDGCEPCRRYVAQIRRARDMMASLDAPQMTVERRDAVLAAYAARRV